MRAALVLCLILIFSSSGVVFAVPIESVPDPQIQGGDQIAVATVPGPPAVKIPDRPVHMYIRQGTDSRFEVFFIDVRYGYDLVDFEYYKAWCLQRNKPIRRNAMHKVILYNSYDPDLPPPFRSFEWNQINYIINHKKGTMEAIQQAIWHFTNPEKPQTLSAEAAQLVEEANLDGKDYRPGEGELLAVICKPQDKKQVVFVVVKIPEAVTFEVAPATFVPPVPPLAVTPPFIPIIPIIPIIPTTPPSTPPPDPPPGPPSTPEPSSLLLLASGVACILISWRVRKLRKKP